MTKEDKQIIDRAIKENWRIGDRTRLKRLLEKNLKLYRENEELKLELTVEKDLADCLNSGGIAGYAADVLLKEPMAADNPLLGAKNCIITPHIAWAPYETRKRLQGIAEENLKAWLAGKPVNVVS